ncbi:MAG: ABC transporter ATP-binding protein [Planctomycetota bacterium]
MSALPLYRARSLAKSYRTGAVEVHALRGVDLDISAGESLVILGPSGSGKSTLLHMLGGMDRPSSGTLHFHDTDLTTLDAAELTQFRRRHVGFVFQLYNLVPSLTALENVALAADVARTPRNPRDMLALVGLEERADHFPAQLSGGEQQRVAIARGVVKAPEVLLCDEPTGALDYETGVRVLEVLQQVNHDLGTTLVIITHNAVIGETASRVIHMSSGRIDMIREVSEPRSPREIAW